MKPLRGTKWLIGKCTIEIIDNTHGSIIYKIIDKPGMRSFSYYSWDHLTKVQL